MEVQTLHPKLTEDPMTDERMALVELLQKSGDGDFLRAVAEAVLQILMEADVEGLIGAGRHERSRRAAQLPQRLSRAQPRHATRLAPAADPEAAPGVVLPALPGAAQDRREGAGHGDPGGLDRRRVDPAGRRAGAGDGPAGISKSQVSKLCKDIDERVNAFLDRPIEANGRICGSTRPTSRFATAAASSRLPQ